MWIWDKITKAKVIRTDNELKVKVFSVLPLSIFIAVFFFAGMLTDSFGITIIIEIVPLILITFFPLIYILWIIRNQFNSGNMTISNSEIDANIREGRSDYRKQFKAPFYIDIQVKTVNDYIRIKIFNHGKNIGYYSLKNGDDLSQFIDGVTTLLDLEFVENWKLSNDEMVSFKSKNAAIHSDIQIKTIPNQMILVSKTNSSKWTEFVFHENKIKNYKRSVDLTEVNKFLIRPNKANIKLEALLNNGKKVELLKHSSTEITVIRDSKLLKTTLENRQELQGIEIEMIEGY